MASVKPGRQYYWRPYKDASGMPPGTFCDAPSMHEMLIEWLEQNVSSKKWSCHGDYVDDITFYFSYKEDAVAFKLKFGL